MDAENPSVVVQSGSFLDEDSMFLLENIGNSTFFECESQRNESSKD